MTGGSDILNDVAAATRLREGAEGVRRIIRAVSLKSELPLKNLARDSRLPLPIVAAVRSELEKRGIFERRGGGVGLTASGEALLKELGAATAQRSQPPQARAAESKTLTDHPADMAVALRMLETAHAAMPRVDVTLDQAFATPETSMRRAMFAMDRDALAGRNVIFIGDDDLTSLAANFALSQLGASARLSVVEIDARITAHILKTMSGIKPEVECLLHDLREPLPPGLRDRFQCFFTDPPYTPDGLRLFLSRAAEALEKAPGMHGFLSYAHKDPDSDLETFQIISECGFAPVEIIPSFNNYAGGGILGNSSRLIHLMSTSSTAPAVSGRCESKIYSGEVNPTVRIYECAACGGQASVGAGQSASTIERLKEAGCAKCGEKKFRMISRTKTNQ